MNNNMKHLCKEIQNGRSLEENIPQLFNHLADDYQTYAQIRLALHYYTFYETYCDDENSWTSSSLDTTNQMNQIISSNILQVTHGKEREEAIIQIDSIRKEIIKRIDALTAYTDVFVTYEHVLNRLEYRFYKTKEPVDNEEFAKDILRFIFDSEDNVIINSKIQDVIGQLPIRMTKQKYMDLIKQSINAYFGSNKSNLDSYLYQLRTLSMLYHEDSMKELYPQLWEKKESFQNMNFKDFKKEDYDKTVIILQSAVFFIEAETSVYYSLAEIVNEIYSFILCNPYAGMVPNKYGVSKEAALQVIREINEKFLKQEKQKVPDTLLELFSNMEGVQEDMVDTVNAMEDALFEVKMNHQKLLGSLMLESMFKVLQRSGALLSNSIFIDLENNSSSQEAIVDEEMVEKEAKLLENEITDLFHSLDKMVIRAVIANTISRMPVFFANHTEVMEYVRYSLDRCTDESEKAACVEIIKELMCD